ncbi:MAG: type II toxin-antitoxin system VapC family toxin [Desulfobacterales bacterium]|nr:type II toxin-antitoxin system VapC family toxin [Desulfobacterales bacterium]
MDWWDSRRENFDVFASEVVIEEAGRGNEVAAARRMEALAGIPLLAITDEVITLSEALIRRGVLPRQAIDDSLHIALAAVHGLDYLLTWNYRHIANAESKPLIRKICLENGFGYPEICTPQELMGGN